MNLQVFEAHAESLYSNNSCKETHEILVKMISSISENQLNNYAETLKLTSNPYAQLWILAQLKEFILSYLNLLEAAQVVDLRGFILANFKNSNSNFVNSALVQLFGILTVLGWYKDERIQKFQDDLLVFQNSQFVELQKIGIDLHSSVVQEMNYSTSSLKKMPKHRKTAVNFRDNYLLEIFKNGQRLLLVSGDTKVRESLLALLRVCLIFDFIGEIVG